ncbi:hypothetical protein BU23DRAFT_567237 [Bimuria novae-zelandiae CBS 107.79]|uniref:Uncharacterized protein n=1 Tax=Bimuria novae-zelandiae CBS 107.79 TaxID=1447943 RepID=A0A6A5VCJ1_9PLEO|nr:hypothetical protein BU23DRAFT_567237 [Bimuria novae-zelandiae CBS 107.79]
MHGGKLWLSCTTEAIGPGFYGWELLMRTSHAFAFSRWRNAGNRKKTLRDLFPLSYESLCEKPHDKIFGVLGLLDAYKPSTIEAHEQTAFRHRLQSPSEINVNTASSQKDATVQHHPPPRVDYNMNVMELYCEVIRYHSKTSTRVCDHRDQTDSSTCQLFDIMQFSQMAQHALSIAPPVEPSTSDLAFVEDDFCVESVANFAETIKSIGPPLE